MRCALPDYPQPPPSARGPDGRTTVPIVSMGLGLGMRGDYGYAADRNSARGESLRFELPGKF